MNATFGPVRTSIGRRVAAVSAAGGVSLAPDAGALAAGADAGCCLSGLLASGSGSGSPGGISSSTLGPVACAGAAALEAGSGATGGGEAPPHATSTGAPIRKKRLPLQALICPVQSTRSLARISATKASSRPGRCAQEGRALTTAVEQQIRPAHVAGERRGEEHAGVGHVTRLAHAAERDRRAHPGDPSFVAVV